MKVSRKVVAQFIAHVVILAAGYAATRYGLHVPVQDAGLIAWAASVVGGLGAGVLARDFPAVVGDGPGSVTEPPLPPRAPPAQG